MKKPADLRAHLVAALPDLARDPELLRIWIEEGTVKTTQAPSRAFEVRYQLNIAILDFAQDPLILMVLINEWLRTHQPAVIASQAASGYDVQVEYMTNSTADLAFTLPLSEIIICRPRDGGGWEYKTKEEDASFDDDLMPVGQPTPNLREIWLGNRQILPDPASDCADNG